MITLINFLSIISFTNPLHDWLVLVHQIHPEAKQINNLNKTKANS